MLSLSYPHVKRCVYELFVAQRLNVKVKLAPYNKDALEHGQIERDDCILVTINNRVDSENAECSWGPDKKAIDDTIHSQS